MGFTDIPQHKLCINQCFHFVEDLLSELQSVLPPKPEPPSVSPTPPSSVRESTVPEAGVQNGTVVIEEPRYVGAYSVYLKVT